MVGSRRGIAFYVATLPVNPAVGGAWRPKLLMVNGAMATVSRLPLASGTWFHSTGGTSPTDKNTLVYEGIDLDFGVSTASAYFRVFQAYRAPLRWISSIDTGSKVVTFTTALPQSYSSISYSPNAYDYEVLNDPTGCAAAGCWYLDYTANQIYYWPRVGENMATVVIAAPTLPNLIQFTGSSTYTNTTISGIDLTMTDAPVPDDESQTYSAMFVNNTNGVLVSSANMYNLGNIGLSSSSSNNLSISRNLIHDVGNHGVITGGSTGQQFTDNTIYNFGLINADGNAIKSAFTNTNSYIAYNTIHDGPYSGIYTGGTGPVVEYNLAYGLMGGSLTLPANINHMNDGGAIYVGQTPSGCNIRNNWAYNIGNGVWNDNPVYYMDVSTTNCTATGNIGVASYEPFLDHQGTTNFWINNYWYSTNTGKTESYFSASTGGTFQGNVISAPSGTSIDLTTPLGGITSVSGNVLYSGGNSYTWTHQSSGGTQAMPSGWTAAKADPLFTAPLSNNFQMLPGSPALAAGIPQPIVFSHVGPRP